MGKSINFDAEEDTDDPLEVLCRDIETGENGRLKVSSEEGAYLEMVSFNNFIPPSPSERILLLETGQYATLFNCVEGGSGVTHRAFSVFNQSTYPNEVVIGPQQWSSGQLIKRLSFTFAGARHAISFSKHLRPEPRAAQIFTIDIEGMSISVGMSLTQRGRLRKEIISTPTISIEFTNGMPVAEAENIASQVRMFFELSMGAPSCFSRFSFSSLNLVEMEENSLEGKDIPVFDLRLRKPIMPTREREAHPAGVLFRFHTDESCERAKFALQRWMERRDVWEHAYGLASGCLRIRDSVDIYRLVRVMAWFEALPAYKKGNSSLSAAEIRKIRKAVSATVVVEGMALPTSRISEVISQLNYPPLSERIDSAIEGLRIRFKGGIVPSTLERDCRTARKIRNDGAHGGLSGSDLRSLYRSLCAVELVCFLSMVADLDPDFGHAEMHPLLTYWHMAGD